MLQWQAVKLISLKLSKVEYAAVAVLASSLSQAITKLRLLLLRFGVGGFGCSNSCQTSGNQTNSENHAIFEICERPAGAIYFHKYLLAKYEIAAECYHLSNFQNTFNRNIYQNQNI